LTLQATFKLTNSARNPDVSVRRAASVLNPIIQIKGDLSMPITAEEREQVVSELRRFGKDLNLTDQQKEKLQSALMEAREKLAEYLKKNPNTTRADIVAHVKEHRDEIRQRVANFLSPDQLTKWNAEVAKAKEFLGQKLEA
jgi:periplasmic protein CpxP/Spy